MKEFDDLAKEKGWVKFENTPVYFQKFVENEWEVYIFSDREMSLMNDIIKTPNITEEYIWEWFTKFSNHIYWMENYMPYSALCMFAADAYFGIDKDKFNYYAEQYERINNRIYNE